MKKLLYFFLFIFLLPVFVHARFFDNGDGTVTDTRTGLTWEQKTDDGGLRDKDNNYTWKEALDYCEALDLGGHTDWRLPTIRELGSLVDLSRWNSSIDTEFFPNTRASYYWSSTTFVDFSDGAWSVDFNDGNGSSNYKLNDSYVRAVRGEKCGLFFVEPWGDCGDNKPCYSSIQDAIENAGYWYKIKVAAGIYEENIFIDKPVTLDLGWDPDFENMDKNFPVLLLRPK